MIAKPGPALRGDCCGGAIRRRSAGPATAAFALILGIVASAGPAAAQGAYDGEWAVAINCTANTLSGQRPITMNVPITVRNGGGEAVRITPNASGAQETNRWSLRITGNSVALRNDGSASDGRSWVYRLSGSAAGPLRFALTGGSFTTSNNVLMRSCEGSMISLAPAPGSLAATGARTQTAERGAGPGGAAPPPPPARPAAAPPRAAAPAPAPTTPATPAPAATQAAVPAPAAAAGAAVAAVAGAGAAVAAAPTAAPPATAPRAPSVPVEGRRVALVIGNGDYTHSTPLRNPANDARRMAEVLERAGFEIVLGIDLDRRAMEQKIREFGNRLDGGRLGLFFYAGHGIQVSGENYLLPTDAALERERDLGFETVALAQVLRIMESSASTNLVFLDACRDNPLSRSLQRSLGARSAAVGQGLAQVQSGLGTLVAYATQPGNVALDGREANSPFTTALAQHLVTPGVDIAIAMRRVRESVVSTTGGRQVPWDHSSLTGDVVLVGAAPAAAPRVATAPDADAGGAALRGAAAPAADREVVFWQSALAGGRPADFEAYLQAYPDGTFAPLARSRLGR